MATFVCEKCHFTTRTMERSVRHKLFCKGTINQEKTVWESGSRGSELSPPPAKMEG